MSSSTTTTTITATAHDGDENEDDDTTTMATTVYKYSPEQLAFCTHAVRSRKNPGIMHPPQLGAFLFSRDDRFPRCSDGFTTGTIFNLSVSQFFSLRRSFRPCALLWPSFRRNSICHADGSFDNILPLDLYVSQNEKINSPAVPAQWSSSIDFCYSIWRPLARFSVPVTEL